MFKKILFILFVSIILSTCSGLKETLSLKKKSSTNEFLVKKKNPLVMPPEFEALPKPIDNEVDVENEILVDDQEIDISKIFKNKNNSKKTKKNNSSKSLENSISDILKDK